MTAALRRKPDQSPLQACSSSNSMIGARECHLGIKVKSIVSERQKDILIPTDHIPFQNAQEWALRCQTGLAPVARCIKPSVQVITFWLLIGHMERKWGLIENGGLDHDQS